MMAPLLRWAPSFATNFELAVSSSPVSHKDVTPSSTQLDQVKTKAYKQSGCCWKQNLAAFSSQICTQHARVLLLLVNCTGRFCVSTSTGTNISCYFGNKNFGNFWSKQHDLHTSLLNEMFDEFHRWHLSKVPCETTSTMRVKLCNLTENRLLQNEATLVH